jgi:hypothetical protein
MSATDWKPISEFVIALGAFLGYLALILEVVLHYTDLKRMIMKPNFQLAMHPKGSFFASIAVTNAKTSWRVCDATECEGKLAIKKHGTKDDGDFDVKETTPLTWEGEEKVIQRIPAGSLTEYLQAFVYDPMNKELGVRIYGGNVSVIVPANNLDIFVQIKSNEKTIGKWLRDVDIVQCIKTGKFPPFTDDC